MSELSIIPVRKADKSRCAALAATMAIATLLSACALLPSEMAAPDTTSPAAALPAPAAAVIPTIPPSTPEPAIARLPEIGKLQGMRREELLSLLGKPDFQRNDPPAELLQYRSADCVVDIFLYGDAGDYRVVHAEARDRGLLRSSVDHCRDGGSALSGRLQQSQL